MWGDLLSKVVERFGGWSQNRALVDQILQMPPQEAIKILWRELADMQDTQYNDLLLTIKGDIWKQKFDLMSDNRGGGRTYEEELHNFKMSQRADYKQGQQAIKSHLKKLEQLESVIKKIRGEIVAKRQASHTAQTQAQTEPEAESIAVPVTEPASIPSEQVAKEKHITNSKKWTTAEELRTAAESGDAEAQDFLGLQIILGKLGPVDFGVASTYFTKAAIQGNTSSQYYLGLLLLKGKGVSKDIAEAIKWLTRSAESNHPEAMYQLGMLYLLGNDVEKNSIEAAKWLACSLKGKAKAGIMGDLGDAFLWNGDIENAFAWYCSSIEAGEFANVTTLTRCYQGGLGLLISPRNCTDTQLKELNEQCVEEAKVMQAQILNGLEVAASAGVQSAKIRLGFLHCLGLHGFEKDYSKALDLFIDASKEPNADAFFGLGLICQQGLGMCADLNLAAQYYTKSIELNSQLSDLAKEQLQMLQS